MLTWSPVCKVTEDWTHAVTEEVRVFDSGQLNGLSLFSVCCVSLIEMDFNVLQ